MDSEYAKEQESSDDDSDMSCENDHSFRDSKYKPTKHKRV